jgi:hypothetical protein
MKFVFDTFDIDVHNERLSDGCNSQKQESH